MSTTTAERLVGWEEIQDIELVILQRMKEYALGAHQSDFHGSGYDLAGLRDWQPGDRPSAIDWAQSTLTNFSPLVTREFDLESTASVIIVADTSLSTRCGVDGTPIARVIARVVATLALAGAFFQDRVGLVAMDGPSRRLLVPPHAGKNHAMHCVDAYQECLDAAEPEGRDAGGGDLGGLLRRRSLLPVVSDFLMDDPEACLKEFAALAHGHDVFVVLVDSAFAFDLPPVSAGWLTGYDVETGRSRLLSARELERLGERVREWQDGVERIARRHGLDVVRVAREAEHEALAEFLRGRKLRKR